MSEIAKCPVCGKEPGTSGRIVDGVDVVENVACCNAWFGDPEEWNQYATLRAENERLKGEVERLREHLYDAKLQIEYLHGKFQETGSGNAILSRIEAALTIRPPHG